ncbi:MAG: PfkB family carbohydrate kinase [Gammaproteobacteria bacterium]|nr:PfkB family carbohydrate kinase [Gammaproteobacteria bacterium]
MADIIVTGTLAQDDVGFFDSVFTADVRNVKLHTIYRDFGGCAMNIAYNLKLLGHEPTPFAYVGDDYAGDYQAHVIRAKINESGLMLCPGNSGARGLILTAGDGQQFTAFYPGPDGRDRLATDLQSLIRQQPFDAAVIAPDLPAKMQLCADHLADIPVRIWCPGQYAELLTVDELRAMLSFPNILIVNHGEWQAIERLAIQDATLPELIVITAGSSAVTVTVAGADQKVAVPAVATSQQIDPTGCGDAFVAGFLHGHLSGLDAGHSATTGIELAAACLRQRGCQRHG